MTDPDSAPGRPRRHPASPVRRPAGKPYREAGRSLSMHDGVAVWCDCCSCEAEPYWVAVAEEMGVDLGSDYEDDRR